MHRGEERGGLEGRVAVVAERPRRRERTGEYGEPSPAVGPRGAVSRRGGVARCGPRCRGSPAAPRAACAASSSTPYGIAVGVAVGMPEVQVPRPHLVAQVLQARRGRRPGPRSPGTRSRRRASAPRRRRTRRPGRRRRRRPSRRCDRGCACTETVTSAAERRASRRRATSRVGSISPEMRAPARPRSAGLALGVVQVLAAAVEVLVDVGAARAQQRRVGLVDDDLGLAAR